LIFPFISSIKIFPFDVGVWSTNPEGGTGKLTGAGSWRAEYRLAEIPHRDKACALLLGRRNPVEDRRRPNFARLQCRTDGNSNSLLKVFIKIYQ
jgi:hypothetical protein